MKSLVFIFPLIFLCLSAQELKFTLAIHSGAIDDERAKFSKELEEEFKLGLKNALREGYEILKNKGTHLDAPSLLDIFRK